MRPDLQVRASGRTRAVGGSDVRLQRRCPSEDRRILDAACRGEETGRHPPGIRGEQGEGRAAHRRGHAEAYRRT